MAKSISQEYKKLINEYWIKNIPTDTKKDLLEKYRIRTEKSVNNAVYTSPNVLLDDIDNITKKSFENILLRKERANLYFFRKGDMLFLFGHGTSKGSLVFDKKSIQPQTVVNLLEDNKLIPEDIKKIYTFNCYGGNQQSFISKNGLPVESAHTSDKPIIGGYRTIKNKKGEKVIAHFGIDSEAVIKDSFKEDLIRNKNKPIEKAITIEQVNKVVDDAFNNPKQINVNNSTQLNDINNINTEIPVKKKYKPKRGPKLKETFKEEPKIRKYKTRKGPKLKEKVKANRHSYDQKDLANFWSHIGFEEGTNRVVYYDKNQRIYMENYFLVQKENGTFIYDKNRNRLYDKDLNYYHQGNYYNKNGEIIEAVKDDKIFDVNPYKTHKAKTKDVIEHFDSEGNSYKLTSQEAFDKYGPNDDRFYTSQGLDPVEQKKKVEQLNKTKQIDIPTDTNMEYNDFIKENEQILDEINDIKNDIKPKYKPKKGPKLKEKINPNTNNLSKKKITEAASDAINKISDIKIPKAGKIGLTVAALGIGAYILGSNKKENNYRQKPNYQTHIADTSQVKYNNAQMYDIYAQQMAKDISSYRYGKKMTGFI